MIKEDYVSFEVAKLLKEKGFDLDCETSYYISNEGCENAVSVGDFTKVRPWREALIAAPTHQMAMKWLRGRNFIIVVQPEYFSGGSECSAWGCDIWADGNYEKLRGDYPIYEEAVEAALKYCLENLI